MRSSRKLLVGEGAGLAGWAAIDGVAVAVNVAAHLEEAALVVGVAGQGLVGGEVAGVDGVKGSGGNSEGLPAAAAGAASFPATTEAHRPIGYDRSGLTDQTQLSSGLSTWHREAIPANVGSLDKGVQWMGLEGLGTRHCEKPGAVHDRRVGGLVSLPHSQYQCARLP